MKQDLGLVDRLRFKAVKSRPSLKVFVDRIWNSSERRIRDRLFQALSDSADIDMVYVKRGPERYLVHCRDKVIGREVFLSGQFDFDKVATAFELVKRHAGMSRVDVLVDVGANIGTVCVPAVARGLAVSGIAIEPDPTNSRLLRINALLNNLDSRIVVHECALGDRDGAKLVLEQSGDNWGDHRISVNTEDGAFGEASRTRIEVPSSRLDTLVSVPAVGTNMLIWMDTQGYEGYVLKGATSLLRAGIPVVSEFWPYGMKRSGGFPAFCEAVAHYRGFVDLNSADASSAQVRPIQQLQDLYNKLDVDKESYTDILMV